MDILGRHITLGQEIDLVAGGVFRHIYDQHGMTGGAAPDQHISRPYIPEIGYRG